MDIATLHIVQIYSRKTMSYFRVNIMAPDDLVTQGARASTAMILTLMAEIIQTLHHIFQMNYVNKPNTMGC